ncbi:replication protein RepA4 [Escherichia coli]|nr:replication protein RepA4 [Escherichia coli]
MRELLCAVGVVPTRVYPKSGRISALAGSVWNSEALLQIVGGDKLIIPFC